jgi:RNA polymerase sigma-70 factor (ECF subfamily)
MNEQERFTRCWTQAQPVVASYIGALVPDFRDAEDLLQEVAVICLRKFPDYDPRRPFAAWALGIARLEALRLRRAHARRPVILRGELLDQIAAACEELAPEMERRSAALRECLKLLRGRAGELVRLRYEEELKPAVLAVRVNMAVVAVRVMLSRTRAALRHCIERRLKAEELRP